MTTTTITEALAELKTLRDRIRKKFDFITSNVARPSLVVDPLAKEGGSESVISRERQAHADLCGRIVKIRVAIQAANLTNTLEVNGQKRTVAEWLSWRREVASLEQALHTGMSGRISQTREKTYAKDASGNVVSNLSIAISEAALATEIENLSITLGQLDGKLSLFNATTTITIA